MRECEIAGGVGGVGPNCKDIRPIVFPKAATHISWPTVTRDEISVNDRRGNADCFLKSHGLSTDVRGIGGRAARDDLLNNLEGGSSHDRDDGEGGVMKIDARDAEWIDRSMDVGSNVHNSH